MRISSEGNVGIGTASPLGKLSILQDTDALGSGISINATANYVNKSAIHINSTGNGTGAGITFENRAINTAWMGHRGSSSTALHFEQENGDFVFASGTYTQVVEHTAPAIVTFKKGGNVGIGSTAPAYLLDVSGTIRATGDVIAYSDARVKDNVETVKDALQTVTSLRGVTYTRKDNEDKSRKVGVIAQEVLSVLPEVVQKDNNGNYSVAYGNMVGVLIEAIKELTTRIEQLENK
jgi:hypothetical protein